MSESLASLFATDDAERQDGLNLARECARLVDPALLPPVSQSASMKLPENYQSEGSVAVMRITGSFMGTAYGASNQWFRHAPAPEVLMASTISNVAKQDLLGDLAMLDLVCGAAIETSPTQRTNRQPAGFFTSVHHASEHTFVTGESMIRVEDNASDPEDPDPVDESGKRAPLAFRFINFRRDQYVTRRDSAGDVLYHVLKERVDPLGLPQAKIARANLSVDQLRMKRAAERMADLYTLVEWQPWTRKWLIRQELQITGQMQSNGTATSDQAVTITEGDERITPYVCTPYRLVSGEHYGRGLIERYRGDLASLDELACRLLQFAEMASWFLKVIDTASVVKPSDLEKGAGSTIFARVMAGEVQDLALLKANQTGDFSVAQAVYDKLRTNIGLAKMSATSSVRDSERTTTKEVDQTIRETDAANFGGISALADRQQQPLIARVREVVLRENIVPERVRKAFEGGAVAPTVLTGIAAMQNRAKFGAIRSFVQLSKEIGEEAASRIDQNVLLDYAARMTGVYVPGLVLTREQQQARVDAAMQKAAQMQAIQQGIETSGKVIEQRAAQSAA